MTNTCSYENGRCRYFCLPGGREMAHVCRCPDDQPNCIAEHAGSRFLGYPYPWATTLSCAQSVAEWNIHLNKPALYYFLCKISWVQTFFYHLFHPFALYNASFIFNLVIRSLRSRACCVPSGTCLYLIWTSLMNVIFKFLLINIGTFKIYCQCCALPSKGVLVFLM